MSQCVRTTLVALLTVAVLGTLEASPSSAQSLRNCDPDEELFLYDPATVPLREALKSNLIYFVDELDFRVRSNLRFLRDPYQDDPAEYDYRRWGDERPVIFDLRLLVRPDGSYTGEAEWALGLAQRGGATVNLSLPGAPAPPSFEPVLWTVVADTSIAGLNYSSRAEVTEDVRVADTEMSSRSISQNLAFDIVEAWIAYMSTARPRIEWDLLRRTKDHYEVSGGPVYLHATRFEISATHWATDDLCAVLPATPEEPPGRTFVDLVHALRELACTPEADDAVDRVRSLAHRLKRECNK